MPLSLKTYFFPVISIKANTDFEKTGSAFNREKFAFFGNVELEDGQNLHCNLLVNIESDSDSSVPYDVELHAFAAFSLDMNLFENAPRYQEGFDGRIENLKVSAVGMVYGAMRELVASTSGRQPWGPFLLPTIIPTDSEVNVVLSDDLEALRESLPTIEDNSKPSSSTRKKAVVTKKKSAR